MISLVIMVLVKQEPQKNRKEECRRKARNRRKVRTMRMCCNAKKNRFLRWRQQEENNIRQWLSEYVLKLGASTSTRKDLAQFFVWILQYIFTWLPFQLKHAYRQSHNDTVFSSYNTSQIIHGDGSYCAACRNQKCATTVTSGRGRPRTSLSVAL